MKRSLAVVGACLALVCTVLTGCAPENATPPPLTDVEAAGIMDTFAQQYTDQLDPLDAAQVRFLRFVNDGDREAVVQRCVRAAGVSNPTDYEQDEPLDSPRNSAWTRCTLAYPPTSFRDRIYSDQQLDYIHDYFEHVLTPCLRSLGVTMANVPTRGELVRLNRDGLYLWDPYRDGEIFPVGDIDANGFAPPQPPAEQLLRAHCPATPPGIVVPEE